MQVRPMNFIHQQRTSQVLSSIFARTQMDSEVLLHLNHGLSKPSVQTEWIDWPMQNTLSPISLNLLCPSTSPLPSNFLKTKEKMGWWSGNHFQNLEWLNLYGKIIFLNEWYFCVKLWMAFLDLVPSLSFFLLFPCSLFFFSPSLLCPHGATMAVFSCFFFLFFVVFFHAVNIQETTNNK